MNKLLSPYDFGRNKKAASFTEAASIIGLCNILIT